MSYDVVIIGSGPGGYVAAIRAAQLGMKVACIDKRKEPGGTCLNVGCIPSKTLLHSSEMLWKMKTPFHLATLMEQKQKVIGGFNEGILALFKKNRITYIPSEAKLVGPHAIQVLGEVIEAQSIILATGSEPVGLPFLPFDEKRIVSSTGALAFEKVPPRLGVIGAGVIGVELGSVYHRLGSQVTFIENLDRICPTLDESLSKELQANLSQQGMVFHLNSKVNGAEIYPHQVMLRVESKEFVCDAVLIAIGRKPYTQGLGLESLGIIPTAKGLVPIDGHFRTAIPHIYAIGDLIDGPMLAHKASEEGVAVAEIIAGHAPSIEYLALPNVVYTYPEVASVGLTEKEIKAFNLNYKTGIFPFKANSRARSTGEEEGFVKIFAENGSDRLLGVHIIGAHASELIAGPALAIQMKLTALNLATTPCAHPTFSEAIKEAALALHQRALHR